MALAAGYGLVADDWQADVVDCSLCRRGNGRYAAATVGQAVARQNGKNGWLEIRELFGMVALGEKFLHTAHEVKTARKAFRRIASFFENERQYPELAGLLTEIRKTNGQEAIALKNGGSIEFIARSSGSGRGFTVDVLVCDEAQDLTDDELAALLPTISAAPLGNPQVVLTGTPPDPEKPEAAKGEVFRRVRREAQAGTDKNLCFVDFGVPDGPLPDVDDRTLWYETNPALGGRLNVAEVERERKLMSPEKFARERLGWWGDPQSHLAGVFGSQWGVCSLEGEAPEATAIGLGVSLDESWGSIGAAGLNADGVPHLGSVDRRLGTDWMVAEVKRIQAARGCDVVIDEKCPDATLLPALQAAGVDVTVAKLSDYVEACSDLRNRVRDVQVTHLGEDLDAAVAVAAWRLVGDGQRVFGRRKSTGDISMLEAATLALLAVGRPPREFWGAFG